MAIKRELLDKAYYDAEEARGKAVEQAIDKYLVEYYRPGLTAKIPLPMLNRELDGSTRFVLRKRYEDAGWDIDFKSVAGNNELNYYATVKPFNG
jgi:hypothetical protein